MDYGFESHRWHRPRSSMDRATASEAVGCGFESHQGRWMTVRAVHYANHEQRQ